MATFKSRGNDLTSIFRLWTFVKSNENDVTLLYSTWVPWVYPDSCANFHNCSSNWTETDFCCDALPDDLPENMHVAKNTKLAGTRLDSIRKGVELFKTNWTLYVGRKWQRAEDQALATRRHRDVTLEVPNLKQICLTCPKTENVNIWAKGSSVTIWNTIKSGTQCLNFDKNRRRSLNFFKQRISLNFAIFYEPLDLKDQCSFKRVQSELQISSLMMIFQQIKYELCYHHFFRLWRKTAAFTKKSIKQMQTEYAISYLIKYLTISRQNLNIISFDKNSLTRQFSRCFFNEPLLISWVIYVVSRSRRFNLSRLPIGKIIMRTLLKNPI